MKIIVAVCVFNRFENIKRWIKCWKQWETKDAELIIIHNYYGDEVLRKKFKDYCNDNGIKYVLRNGQGFDIGAYQDVCKERLTGFYNDWNYLLWCTDDIFPMTKNFITPFIEKLQDKSIGIAAMQISSSVSPHVRTTGFCISKETSLKIKFKADPIKTKSDCYHFEHRGGKDTLTNQVRQMGLSCVAVSEIKNSPLWDSDHPNKNKREDRLSEFNKVWGFKNKDKVVIICPIFDAFPEIISSLICQTHKNWQLLLIDDNPEETVCKPIIDAVNDKRITYIKRGRMANYGHPHRQWALNELKENRLCDDADYVLITNGDNSYAPVFFEYMLNGFKNNPKAKAVYCSEMVHSYINWNIIKCRPALGYLDCGGVIVKKDIATEIGWRDIKSHSSDFTYFEDIIKQYSISSFVPVQGTLFMHN